MATTPRRLLSGKNLGDDAGANRTTTFTNGQERIAAGQHVAAWRIEGQAANGAWTALARGTTIGHKRIVAVPAAEQAAVRVVIEQALAPVDGLSMVLHAEA